jgi:Acetyltransferase (GNAT) domain/PilZ domain
VSPFSPSRKYISDRRAHVRRRTGSPAYIEPGEGNRALVLSISESGLGLRADRPLTEDPTLRMRFLLPESKSWVQTNGRIAWISESRKEAGIRFIDLPEDARNTIQKWVLLESLQEQSGKLSGATEKNQQLAEFPRPFSIREIRFDRGWTEVADRWKECNSHFPDHTLECNPDWIEEHFKHEKDRVRIFLLEGGDAVVGAVPCVLDQELACNLGEFTVAKFPMRILRWLGYTPNVPGEESAYNMLFEEILKSGFDAVHIPGLKTESFAWNYLRYSPLIRKLFWYQIPRQPSPHLLIRLDGTFDSYMNRLSAKTRKNRLREIGELRQHGDLQLIRFTKSSEIDAFLEPAYAISRRTWQFHRVARGLARRDRDLVRDELRFLAEHGWLRCYVLKSDNEPCSFVLGQQYGRYFYVDAAGVDQAWRSYSAGTVIFMLVLKDLFEANSPQFYDFGAHARFKDYLASESYPEADVWLLRRRPYPLLTSSIYRACNAVSTKTGAALDRFRLKSRVKKLLWSRE